MADALSDAQELYREALEASREQRDQIAEDLAFSDPSDPQQWDETEKRQRETDPGGARPCLVFDQLGQYVANVAGQVESAPPSLHALPVDGGADKKVAEQLDGHFRHIEHASRAYNHYQRAYTSAARCGVGYMIVRPEVVDDALRYQEPRIGSEGDPLRVVLDPYSVELDGRDARFGYVLTPFSQREFKRRWPKADAVSFGDDNIRRSRDPRDSVMVAEAWQVEEQNQNWITFLDRKGDEVSLREDDFHLARNRGEVTQLVGNRMVKAQVVWWRRMSGAEVLETSQDLDGKDAPYPADRIGIVPMYGYVGFADGRLRYCGIPRRAMAAQRAYNYHMSEIRAFTATAPKAPWIVPVRSIAGLEKLWDRASVEQRAYLPFHDVDESGAPINAPQRPQLAVNLQNLIQGAQQAREDIQAAIGMYQANLGAPSNETSGVAIEQRKQQGESSTAHFQSHGAASIAAVGDLCLQMVCKLMDTKRRMRVLGIDGTSSVVMVNPAQAEAKQETPDGLSINPNIGKYDVRVVVGAAYTTQRAQAQQAFTEMMRANPNMAPVIAPLWAQTLDVPHADKLAEVLIASAPPEVQAILKPEAQEASTGELQAKVQQLQQALQEAIQHAQEAQTELEQAHAEHEAKEAEMQIKAYDAITKRLQVMGTTLTPEMVAGLVQQTVQQAFMVQPSEEEPEQPEQYEMQPFPAAMDSPNAEMAPEMTDDDAFAGQ